MKATSLLLAAAITAFAWPARADNTSAACSDAYTRAQTLRRDHKLLEARDALRTCARPTCKDFIVKDCTRWLDQVQAAVPTVVPVALDREGNILAGVRVAMDGAPLFDSIEGRAAEVDPGSHTFAFTTRDGAHAEVSAIVAEGDTERRVVATFGPPPAAPGASTPASVPAASKPPPSAPAPSDAPAPSAPGPWRTVGIVGTAVGVAGLGVGGYFGLEAIAKKNDAHCSAQSVCPDETAASTLRQGQTAGNISTILIAAGAAVTAGGALLWALAPHATVQTSAWLGDRQGGAMVSGRW